MVGTPIPSSELEMFRRLSKHLKVVLDVGCRDDIDYYHIHPDCEYRLFEPMKEALNSLKAKISELEKHNIHVHEYGLSDVDLDDQVYYDNVQSFIPHWYVPSNDTGSRYNLRLLDDYISLAYLDRVDFLKIDVEGLDYNVLIGGIKSLLSGKVSYLQVEYSGGVRQYVDLLPNFQFYWMMEPVLLAALIKANPNNGNCFNKSLIKLDDTLIDFIDEFSKTGNGGNIFGVLKTSDLDIEELTFEIL